MSTLILQKDVFTEDENHETETIIRKYFPKIEIISDKDIMLGLNKYCHPSFCGPFRGSLALASLLGRKFQYTNALRWAPAFQKEIVSKDFAFLDATSIYKRDLLATPLFVRPVDGFKAFGGNVFTKETFKNEFMFMTVNKNIDPYITCLYASPVPLKREWRLIFINNHYSSGSQYMEEGQLSLKTEIPSEVVEFTKKIAKTYYFQNIFEFVIDVAETPDGIRLLEINAFETASFYKADLEKVYSDWANALNSI